MWGLHHLCLCCAKTGLCVCLWLCFFLLTVFVDIDLFLSLWHVCTSLPSFFRGPGGGESVSVSISAALRGRSFSHLSAPRISQSEVTASSVPPPLPPFKSLFPPSLCVIPRSPSRCLLMHISRSTFTNTHQSPVFCRQMLTDYLVYWCQLVSHLKWIYIPLPRSWHRSGLTHLIAMTFAY